MAKPAGGTVLLLFFKRRIRLPVAKPGDGTVLLVLQDEFASCAECRCGEAQRTLPFCLSSEEGNSLPVAKRDDGTVLLDFEEKNFACRAEESMRRSPTPSPVLLVLVEKNSPPLAKPGSGTVLLLFDEKNSPAVMKPGDGTVLLVLQDEFASCAECRCGEAQRDLPFCLSSEEKIPLSCAKTRCGSVLLVFRAEVSTWRSPTPYAVLLLFPREKIASLLREASGGRQRAQRLRAVV